MTRFLLCVLLCLTACPALAQDMKRLPLTLVVHDDAEVERWKAALSRNWTVRRELLPTIAPWDLRSHDAACERLNEAGKFVRQWADITVLPKYETELGLGRWAGLRRNSFRRIPDAVDRPERIVEWVDWFLRDYWYDVLVVEGWVRERDKAWNVACENWRRWVYDGTVNRILDGILKRQCNARTAFFAQFKRDPTPDELFKLAPRNPSWTGDFWHSVRKNPPPDADLNLFKREWGTCSESSETYCAETEDGKLEWQTRANPMIPPRTPEPWDAATNTIATRGI